MNKKFLNNLDNFLEDYLVKKAPALPTNIKEGIVKYGPYVILISLLFSIPSVLALFGLGSMFNTIGLLRFSPKLSLTYQLSLVVMLVGLVFEVLALPVLFQKTKKSWNLMYYSVLVYVFHYIFTQNIGGLVIGTILSLYILFQIKSYYK